MIMDGQKTVKWVSSAGMRFGAFDFIVTTKRALAWVMTPVQPTIEAFCWHLFGTNINDPQIPLMVNKTLGNLYAMELPLL